MVRLLFISYNFDMAVLMEQFVTLLSALFWSSAGKNDIEDAFKARPLPRLTRLKYFGCFADLDSSEKGKRKHI